MVRHVYASCVTLGRLCSAVPDGAVEPCSLICLANSAWPAFESRLTNDATSSFGGVASCSLISRILEFSRAFRSAHRCPPPRSGREWVLLDAEVRVVRFRPRMPSLVCAHVSSNGERGSCSVPASGTASSKCPIHSCLRPVTQVALGTGIVRCCLC